MILRLARNLTIPIQMAGTAEHTARVEAKLLDTLSAELDFEDDWRPSRA